MSVKKFAANLIKLSKGMKKLHALEFVIISLMKAAIFVRYDIITFYLNMQKSNKEELKILFTHNLFELFICMPNMALNDDLYKTLCDSVLK